MVITSLDNPKIKKYLKLKTKKYRDNFKLYLVETDNLIKEAIKTKETITLPRKEEEFDNILQDITHNKSG